MASAELWPSSAENILYFGVQKRLRAFLYPIFTGWGVGNKLPQSSLRDASPLWDGAFVPLQRGSLIERAGCKCSEQTEEVRLFHLFCGFFVFSA